MKPKFTIGKKIVIWEIVMNWETNFVRILFGLEKWFQKWIMLPKLLEADIFIIGTSMQVYPAAGLIHYVPKIVKFM
jgi:hypothetical protein